jgi:hypothetical protein
LIDQRALRGFPHGISCNNQDNPMELPGIQVQVGKLSKWLISPIAWLFLKALGFFFFVQTSGKVQHEKSIPVSIGVSACSFTGMSSVPVSSFLSAMMVLT